MNNELYHYNHNHDPKTGKFTFSRESANKLIRLEKEDPQKFAKEVNSIKEVRKFEKKNIKPFNKALGAYNDAYYELNTKAGAYARKELGLKKYESFPDLVEKVNRGKMDPNVLGAYISAGNDFIKSKDGTAIIKEPYERLKKEMRNYEKASRKFVQEFLGEYGDLEVQNDLSIKYNKETGKIEKQTLADRFAYEMYRHAGGYPL
jgi:hypothetical protein